MITYVMIMCNSLIQYAFLDTSLSLTLIAMYPTSNPGHHHWPPSNLSQSVSHLEVPHFHSLLPILSGTTIKSVTIEPVYYY